MNNVRCLQVGLAIALFICMLWLGHIGPFGDDTPEPVTDGAHFTNTAGPAHLEYGFYTTCVHGVTVTTIVDLYTRKPVTSFQLFDDEGIVPCKNKKR